MELTVEIIIAVATALVTAVFGTLAKNLIGQHKIIYHTKT